MQVKIVDIKQEMLIYKSVFEIIALFKTSFLRSVSLNREWIHFF